MNGIFKGIYRNYFPVYYFPGHGYGDETNVLARTLNEYHARCDVHAAKLKAEELAKLPYNPEIFVARHERRKNSAGPLASAIAYNQRVHARWARASKVQRSVRLKVFDYEDVGKGEKAARVLSLCSAILAPLIRAENANREERRQRLRSRRQAI